MKHYKEGRNHIFEFGEMSITRIKLKEIQYEELANYFAERLKKLEHHEATTVGLWATDRPDLIEDPKGVLFQITGA